MAGLSQFSTPENYTGAIDAKAKLQEALREAEIAKQAGLPGADQLVTQAQDGLKAINQFLSVYFPTGEPGAGQ